VTIAAGAFIRRVNIRPWTRFERQQGRVRLIWVTVVHFSKEAGVWVSRGKKRNGPSPTKDRGKASQKHRDNYDKKNTETTIEKE